jgi:acetyl/propionyl-CoA carboxylase alpha subunit
MRTGIDLVAEQIRIAEGEPLSFSQQDVTVSGHAMECRIYAEDPRNNYLPSTGRIHHLKPSQGFSVRDDRGVEAGNEVTVYYDPMISKLIVWGRSREEARRRMLRSLRDYEVLGVETNIPLNIAVLEHPRFIEGNLDTHFLDECLPTLGDDQLASHEETAAVAVATLLHAERSHDTRCSFLSGSKDSSRGMKPSPQTVSHKQWRSTRLDHMRGSQ